MNYIPDIPKTVLDVFRLLPEGTRCEIIDDALYMLPSTDVYHQDVLGDVAVAIHNFIEDNDKGDLFIGPFDVYFNSHIVQPDIFFIRKENSGIIHKNGIHGLPDFIIEILLPVNSAHDMEKKFNLYQKNHIPEYIIIDPQNKQVWHYMLEHNYYQRLPSRNGELSISSLNAQFLF